MDNIFGNVYKNKRVLITGHTGFKGTWLSIWLKELGAKVRGYSLDANTQPNLFSICNVSNDIESTIADIRCGEDVYNVINEFKPDIIFHLAAQPLVRYSYNNPKETYETNVMGTLNVYEAVRK